MLTEEETPSTLVQFMQRHAQNQPDKVYLRHGHGKSIAEVTFGSLWSIAQSFQASYGQTDLRGRVCFLFYGSGPEAYLTFWGLIAAGAIPALMPLPSAKQEPEQYWSSHKKLFEKTRPAAVFSGADDLRQMAEYGLFDDGITAIATEYELEHPVHAAFEVVKGAVREADIAFEDAKPTEVAFLQHSSGTTGLKKGVMLSHSAVLQQVASYKTALDAP